MLTGTCLCGACTWRFTTAPPRATACDCSACRRYGAIWIYGHKGETTFVEGPHRAFIRSDDPEPSLSFDTCERCGNLLAWTSLGKGGGPLRQALNLRLADDPAAVAAIPVYHHEGDRAFGNGTTRGTVADIWF